MNQEPSTQSPYQITRILPWLHLAAAMAMVTLQALYSVVHSELGREISAGESPGLAWIQSHIQFGLAGGAIFLIAVGGLQLSRLSRVSAALARLLKGLACLEVLNISAILLLIFNQRPDMLPPVQTALLVLLLIQALITFWNSGQAEIDGRGDLFLEPERGAGRFLFLLILAGAVIAFCDPSAKRMADQIFLDSDFEQRLAVVFPPVLSAITSFWFGVGMLAIAVCISRGLPKIMPDHKLATVKYSLLFMALAAFFAAVLSASLMTAIRWEISKLDLSLTVLQLFLLSSIGGGILLAAVYGRIAGVMRGFSNAGGIGVVAFTFGAAIIWPAVWWLTLNRFDKNNRWLLLISVLGASGFVVYFILFGDMFNPWFTAFSYLKGNILKLTAAVVAGTVVLLIEGFLPGGLERTWSLRRWSITLVLMLMIGFLPFHALGYHPEVKAVVLQFNELARVDAALARKLANALGLGRWMSLGQQPADNGNGHPWPQPWRLKKTSPSRLPRHFNLLVIVVDSLRGDAFHSAGYPRNLTPFLDQWARDEAVSFRRAYSQGGGSFAAFPFLVAGRSRFTLYGPGLYDENLYHKLALAEGIDQFMVMKDFGPRHIFPPDAPVVELDIPRVVSDRQSATADEVFDAARRELGKVAAGDRFLCFLHLMDVHNDLWKKHGGLDFGNHPRDIYDNNLSYLDRAFERFVGWLKQKKLYERTVILFTSDHGEQFWEHGASLHGHTLYEEEIHIPLILRAPGLKGRFEDVPVIAADMVPTIVELAGYTVAPPYDDPAMGVSLVPLIVKNETQQYLRRDIVGRASFKRRYFLYHNWEWKLIYFAELDLLQLFNVYRDPGEKNNLVNEEPEMAARLEKALLDYLQMVEGKSYRSVLGGG